ncbi:MAG: class I SAM-dependent methyltransferase [Gemmatimonadales bacterium]|nr:class I SAM-dependent methyltransferase [Gemmatimonadales bacterium]
MILYQNHQWLVVNKPAGMATHAPRAGELGVVEWLEVHLGRKTHVVSRLDRGTTGVLMLALDSAVAATAQKIHEDGGATKIYEFFSPLNSEQLGLGESWIREDELDEKPARTVFHRVETFDPGSGARSLLGTGQQPVLLTRYRAEITRGRWHQIRRHAAASGLPILGDDEHGGAPWPRLCLHCAEVRWPGLDQPLTAELPPSFREMLQDKAGGAGAAELGFALCRDRRGSWLQEITDSSRVVHRNEIRNLPVAVDVFGEWFKAAWFDEEADPEKRDRRLEPLLDLVAQRAGCRGGVLRIHRSNPHQRKLVTETRVIGEPPPESFTATEHGLRYEINLTRTQHPGLFLDQRDSRRRIALMAEGKRLANLFAFTCSFSVAAAASGAEVAFSVDLARSCLNTGKTNFELNGLAETGRGKFIQEDTRKWFKRQLRRKENKPEEFQALDLVVCDPPVFASSRDGGQFILEKEWPGLVRDTASLLAQTGTAVFANNHRTGNEDSYRNALREFFQEVVHHRPPLDFPVLKNQPPHVRIYFCKGLKSD